MCVGAWVDGRKKIANMRFISCASAQKLLDAATFCLPILRGKKSRERENGRNFKRDKRYLIL